jgi:hypothetical protein
MQEREKLEAVIKSDETSLQGALAQALVNLKQQRSDLFTISGEEQMVRLVGEFLKRILT